MTTESQLDKDVREFREDVEDKIANIIVNVLDDAPVPSPNVMAKAITEYIFNELL